MNTELVDEDSRKMGQRSRTLFTERIKSKSGWLLKRSGAILKKFRKKYLTLENRVLHIYRNEQKTSITSIVNFNLISAATTINLSNPQNLLLTFKGNSKTFIFKGSAEEIIDWSKALNEHISTSLGSSLNTPLFRNNEKFWKFDYITESNFRSSAKTGDLIFFKGNGRMCSAFRGIFNSEFDHIALIYILNNYIYFFESTRATGVSLQSWDEFMNQKWYGLYSRLGYRKLDIDRTQEFNDISDEFIRNNIGKPYKLFKFRNNDDTGYFCSELIAEFYKKTGVFSNKTSASKYYPKNFLSNNASFVQGELGPLKDIKFFNEF